MTNNTYDVFGVYSYKAPLIKFLVDDHRNWKHRELAVKSDFLAKAYITKLDEEIFAERPIFTPNIFPKKEEELEPKDAELDASELSVTEKEPEYDVLYEWELEKWDDLNKKMFDSARTHSFSVVQLYSHAPWWRVFTWREITKIEYDENDNPIGCHVRWDKKLIGADKWRFHEEDLVFYKESELNNDDTALLVPFGIPMGDDLGEYDLEQLWPLMIYARYQVLDIANNSAKTSGFYHWIYGPAIQPDQKQDMLDGGAQAGSGSGVGATRGILEEIRPIFPGKPEFTVLALEETLKLFAGAARLPLAFFRSEREGGGFDAGTAGYVDEGLVTKKKKYIFGEFASAIKKLVEMRWGIIVEDVVPFIQAEFDAIELETKEKAEQEEFNSKEEIE